MLKQEGFGALGRFSLQPWRLETYFFEVEAFILI